MLTLLIATTALPHGFSTIAKIQLMPALLSLNIGILAFWLVATSLLGRVYCSTVCPLGLFQDICARIGKLLKKKPKRRYRYSAAHNRLPMPCLPPQSSPALPEPRQYRRYSTPIARLCVWSAPLSLRQP